MRLLLINPPRSPFNEILAHAPEEALKFIHKKLIGPPLGLLTIASSLDCEIELLDMKGEYDFDPDAPSPDQLVTRAVKDFQPDIVGVTVITSEFNSGMRALEVVKNLDKDIITIAGGLHASLCPEHFDERKQVDIIMTGHGVIPFRKINEIIKKKGRPPINKLFDYFGDIGSISIRKGNHLVKNTGAIEPYDISGRDFIFPRRDLVKKWISTYKVGKNPFPSTYIFSSISCPYTCMFCSIWPQYEKRYQQRHIESIIDELKTLDDYPAVRFADANTLVNPQFAKDLFKRIAEEGLDKKGYIMDIRADFAVKYPEIIEQLAKCGLKVVICGFESSRDEELVKFNKDASVDMIPQAIEIFHANGISLRGNYVVDPEYGVDDFKYLADFSAANEVDFAGYTILTPMPGTPYYEEVKDKIIDWNWDKYNFFNCVMKTKLPLEEFYDQQSKLWLIRRGDEVI